MSWKQSFPLFRVEFNNSSFCRVKIEKLHPDWHGFLRECTAVLCPREHENFQVWIQDPTLLKIWGNPSDLSFSSETTEVIIIEQTLWTYPSTGSQNKARRRMMTAIDHQMQYTPPSDAMYWLYYLAYMQSCKNIFTLPLTENITHFQRYILLV